MRGSWFGMFLTVMCSATTGHGTSVADESLASLTQKAERIVRGTVINVQSRWHGQVIVTDITLRVLHVARGHVGATMTLTQLGGTVGETTLSVAGAPSWQRGVEVVVFAQSRGWR